MDANKTQSPREGDSRCQSCGGPAAEEVQRDVDAIFWSLRLHGVRRFFHQRFWEAESQEAECAARCETWPALESVSEHSWHVADMVLLLSGHFRHIDQRRCLELAILHDKLEIITGDADPVGDGTGNNTHAFNPTRREEKDRDAKRALRAYVSMLRPPVAERQGTLLEEIIQGTSPEANFVKGVDKLQAFAFVITKKRGEFQDKHLAFTLQYVERGVSGFPGLWRHFREMRHRLIQQVAQRRQTDAEAIEGLFGLDRPGPRTDEQPHTWTHSETSP